MLDPSWDTDRMLLKGKRIQICSQLGAYAQNSVKDELDSSQQKFLRWIAYPKPAKRHWCFTYILNAETQRRTWLLLFPPAYHKPVFGYPSVCCPALHGRWVGVASEEIFLRSSVLPMHVADLGWSFDIYCCLQSTMTEKPKWQIKIPSGVPNLAVSGFLTAPSWNYHPLLFVDGRPCATSTSRLLQQGTSPRRPKSSFRCWKFWYITTFRCYQHILLPWGGWFHGAFKGCHFEVMLRFKMFTVQQVLCLVVVRGFTALFAITPTHSKVAHMPLFPINHLTYSDLTSHFLPARKGTMTLLSCSGQPI